VLDEHSIIAYIYVCFNIKLYMLKILICFIVSRSCVVNKLNSILIPHDGYLVVWKKDIPHLSLVGIPLAASEL
jgi:hypothetical protein